MSPQTPTRVRDRRGDLWKHDPETGRYFPLSFDGDAFTAEQLDTQFGPLESLPDVSAAEQEARAARLLDAMKGSRGPRPRMDFGPWWRHCEDAHPSPIYVSRRGPKEVEPSWCEVCARLAPTPMLVAWHHTDEAAADQIMTSGTFHGRGAGDLVEGAGWVFLTTWATFEHGTPGTCPRGLGKVIEVAVPAGHARVDTVRNGEVQFRADAAHTVIRSVR